MSSAYDREYWARRHYDQNVADHYDELYGESARGLREANIRTMARLALMTPEERAANDASALRDMGEYLCPKHLAGADRERWISQRTAQVHAMRADNRRAAELNAKAAGLQNLPNEGAWRDEVTRRIWACTNRRQIDSIAAEVETTAREFQVSVCALSSAFDVLLNAARRLEESAAANRGAKRVTKIA